MAVSISEWYNEVRVETPGVTQDVVDLAIKATAREFYTKSGLWVETIEGLGTTAAVGTLDLTNAAVLDGHDAIVSFIAYIKYGDLYLKPQHSLNSDITGDTPTNYYMLESGNAKLIPTPAATVPNIMKAEVILVPAFSTDVLPNDAKNIWFEEILDGVLGRLQLQQGKTYSNLGSAQYRLRRFRQGIARARDIARRRYTKTESSWEFPAWA